MFAPSEVTCPPTTFYNIGKLMGPLKLTVGEIIGDFFYENSNKLKKEGILEEYEFLEENFIEPEIGHLYDNEITNSILTAFVNLISNKYNKDSAIACVDFLRRVFDWYGSKIKGFLNPVYGIKICDFDDKHRRMSQVTLALKFFAQQECGSCLC